MAACSLGRPRATYDIVDEIAGLLDAEGASGGVFEPSGKG